MYYLMKEWFGFNVTSKYFYKDSFEIIDQFPEIVMNFEVKKKKILLFFCFGYAFGTSRENVSVDANVHINKGILCGFSFGNMEDVYNGKRVCRICALGCDINCFLDNSLSCERFYYKSAQQFF
ncbi:hypothetical protein RFI_07963 [Reticulomyxa filosa]|uniref:Uncharacterized protein n=1 Tax=Reticulomyxa filosa TaxID=46433 RepID=X6NT17_RETFI|nr:hypothetical protein RFI_07963 [Reticulomyxa filosa]|eukprot:ETO29161.1 hypothetical protein RFI_07963 [Reticulomyxa filosa]